MRKITAKSLTLCMAFALAIPSAAWADDAANASLAARIEHHRQMAETRIRQHQAMTAAHLAGREPICPAADQYGQNATFFSPPFGESRSKPRPNGGDNFALNEMRMYWQGIPDFGITGYEIYPSATGWAQVLYWSGTAKDGKKVTAQEADIFRTDANDRLIRVENYHDWIQWRNLAALANGKDPNSFTQADYVAALLAQAKSPNEICRPPQATP